ncbi:hypothetical protein [uncultured Gammaproteobacteria bacterium]|nr:hypothetical protein [uncultured Gammaproteobacteria bacterium]
MSITIPKVFISYSHDDQAHKKWVVELTQRLRNKGVDAILDQFRVNLGEDLGSFMENSVANSDRIIVICTNRYVIKAKEGSGGVGYEKMIMTSDYMQNINTKKFIPLIRQEGTNDVPIFLKSRSYINFSREDEFEVQFDKLLREIHGKPLFKEPPVGNNPFESVTEKPAESVTDKKTELLKSLINDYNRGENVFMFDYLFNNSACSRILSESYIDELENDGFLETSPALPYGEEFANPSFTLTQKAKLYAIQQRWVTK